MSEYIRTNKFDTNECPNIFVKEKLIRTNVRIYIRDQYIRIFEYSNIFVTLCAKSDGPKPTVPPVGQGGQHKLNLSSRDLSYQEYLKGEISM